YDPREGGVHVQKQLLQVEEVPGCLGRVWRDVRVGTVDQGSINQGREDREAEGERGRGDELDEDEVGPDEHFFFALAARSDLRRRYGSHRTIISCSGLKRPGHAAVPADPPEVNGHEDSRD